MLVHHISLLFSNRVTCSFTLSRSNSITAELLRVEPLTIRWQSCRRNWRQLCQRTCNSVAKQYRAIWCINILLIPRLRYFFLCTGWYCDQTKWRDCIFAKWKFLLLL